MRSRQRRARTEPRPDKPGAKGEALLACRSSRERCSHDVSTAEAVRPGEVPTQSFSGQRRGCSTLQPDEPASDDLPKLARGVDDPRPRGTASTIDPSLELVAAELR